MPVAPPHPPAKILASTNVLSDSINVTTLGELYKWNQTVFVLSWLSDFTEPIMSLRFACVIASERISLLLELSWCLR